VCIAFEAAANRILPRRSATAAARDDVVEAELADGFRVATVLATVTIACEEVSAVESKRVLGDAIVVEQPYYSRHLYTEIDGADPVLVGQSTEFFGPQIADEQPRFEVVVGVVAFVQIDDFSQCLVEQREGAAHINDVDGHVTAVENKHTCHQGETGLIMLHLAAPLRVTHSAKRDTPWGILRGLFQEVQPHCPKASARSRTPSRKAERMCGVKVGDEDRYPICCIMRGYRKIPLINLVVASGNLRLLATSHPIVIAKIRVDQSVGLIVNVRQAITGLSVL